MRRIDEVALRPPDRAALDEAARVLRAHAPVDRIVLFGSKSRGDDDAESDIDLLVLTTRPLSRPERHAAMDRLYPIQLARDVVFSPLIVWRDDWEGGRVSALPIHGEIEDHGAVL